MPLEDGFFFFPQDFFTNTAVVICLVCSYLDWLILAILTAITQTMLDRKMQTMVIMWPLDTELCWALGPCHSLWCDPVPEDFIRSYADGRGKDNLECDPWALDPAYDTFQSLSTEFVSCSPCPQSIISLWGFLYFVYILSIPNVWVFSHYFTLPLFCFAYSISFCEKGFMPSACSSSWLCSICKMNIVVASYNDSVASGQLRSLLTDQTLIAWIIVTCLSSLSSESSFISYMSVGPFSALYREGLSDTMLDYMNKITT